MTWLDITLVQIRTTGDGPLGPDVFWGFHTRDRNPAVVVVGGATGEQEMIKALNDRLPGFKNSAVIRAMGCTDHASFVCWKAPEQ